MLGRKLRLGIAGKLAVYLTITLLIFSLVIGVAFALLFQLYSQKTYVGMMERTAYSIRDMMVSLARQQGSIVIGDGAGSPGRTKGVDDFGNRTGGGFHLSAETLSRFVSGVTDSTIWMIAPDSDGDSFDMLFLMRSEQYADTDFTHLPASLQNFILSVYGGMQQNTMAFSSVMEERTITVGVPILREDGSSMGAVLVHNSSSGIWDALENGLFILLLSLLFAFLIGCGCLIFVVRKFSKPLVKINQTALLISEGDYTARTEIKSYDEIGMLAATIDAMSGKLQKASEETESLMRMRQEFVANISHELRTPVTVMRGSLEALCDHVVTEPSMVENYHRELLKESVYMQRLVNDLLDLSRLQNPDFSMNIQEFNLCDCVSDAVRSARRIADGKGIAVRYEYDTLEYSYCGDYDRVRQMLLIVLENAVKFTEKPENPVTVRFRENRVSVTNIGCGIREDELPYIFERFYKSRSESNKNGTGLGLAIAKQIALRHGIGISVRSVPAGETTFWFDFGAAKKQGEMPDV